MKTHATLLLAGIALLLPTLTSPAAPQSAEARAQIVPTIESLRFEPTDVTLA